MDRAFSTADLQGYLDEALPTEMMTAIEEALRDDEQLASRLAHVVGRRDAGVHALGEIWRRHRLTCPSREELGSLLLGVLDQAAADYIRFHLDTVGCRYCAANIVDLKNAQAADANKHTERRKKYFQSSAGYLSKGDA